MIWLWLFLEIGGSFKRGLGLLKADPGQEYMVVSVQKIESRFCGASRIRALLFGGSILQTPIWQDALGGSWDLIGTT